MKKLLLILLALSLMVVLFAGCGDDDESTVGPATVRAALFAQGYARLDSTNGILQLDSQVDFYNLNSDSRDIDSANLSGIPVHIQKGVRFSELYGNGIYSWVYTDTSDQRFQDGDTVDINIYFQNSMSKASVKLLSYDIRPNIFFPPINDTSNLGVPVNYIFNSLPNADWYGILWQYYHDSSGINVWTQRNWAQTDTAFTIAGADLIQNGFMYAYIVAGTGPLPDGTDGDNVSGDLIDGAIYSYSMSSSIVTYLGTGTPDAPANDEINDSEDIAGQIMFELTGIKPPAHRGSTDRPIQ